MDKRISIVVIVLLLLALIGALVWGFNNSAEAEGLGIQNTETNQALSDMTEIRDNLTREVESLQTDYQSLATTNQELEGQLSTSKDELTKAQSAISRAKRNGAAEANDLKAQIEALLQARSGLEGAIAGLQRQNDSLQNRTVALESDLSMSREENNTLNNMNEAMQREVNKLTLDNFRATAFQVELLQKNGEKVTAKSRQARRMQVTFDLAGVPQQYQGVRPLYLVVTDEKGTPIATENYISATSTVNGSRMDLQALAAKDVNIGASQRLSFNHELDERLRAGFYRASVYTDIGLLGAANFRLR